MALTDNLVSYWKFDETSGTNANDEVGSNDGTLTNATFNSSGKINYGVLTSNGAYISLPQGTCGTIGTGDFGISFWFNPVAPSSGTYPMLFGSYYFNYPYNLGPTIFFDPLNNCRKGNGIIFRTTAADEKIITDPSASSLYNTWTHIVFTRVSGTCYVYYNGVEKTSWSDTTNIPAASANSVFMNGRNLSVQNWGSGAKFDECGFWSRGLTSTDVTSLYNSGNGLQYPFSGEAIFTPIITMF